MAVAWCYLPEAAGRRQAAAFVLEPREPWHNRPVAGVAVSLSILATHEMAIEGADRDAGEGADTLLAGSVAVLTGGGDIGGTIARR